MGTDIHLSVEKKLPPGDELGEWQTLCIWDDTPRWYNLFAKMCGVRGYSDDDPEPRGLPKDSAHRCYLFEKELRELHSISWLSTQEFLKIYESMGNRELDGWELLYIFLKSMPVETRLVFGFDC